MVITDKYSGKFLLLVLIACFVGLWVLPFINAKLENKLPAPSLTEPIAQSHPITKSAVSEKFGSGFDENLNRETSTLTTEALWKRLLASIQRERETQIDLENEFIERLRKEPDSVIYQEFLALFRQGSLKVSPQQVLVSLLGEVGDYKAAETLMSLVNEALLVNADVKSAAFAAISKFSPELWHEHPNTELAPVFESAWQTGNAEYWPAIANVMASIGTPSTLDIFVETLTDNTNAERVAIVKQAMTNLVNPDLTPKLAELLENPATENVQLASGNALANMGELEAATTLFDWSAQVDAGKIGLVKHWFETAMNTTPEFVAYLETNLDSQKFTDPKIKTAISSALKNVKSSVE